MVCFTPFKYRFPFANELTADVTKTSVTDDADINVSRCTLYLPGGFTESAGSSWEYQPIIGGAADNALGKGMTAAYAAVGGEGAAKITNTGAAYFGQIAAPMDLLIFNGPNPVEISFQFQFLPISKNENLEIAAIVKNFKNALQPGSPKSFAGVPVLRYPPIWDLTFEGISGIGYGTSDFYSWMALTKADVTYSGDTGIHVYQDKLPIQTNLNLSFKCVKKFILENDKKGSDK